MILSEDQLACIDLLEEALEQVREGNINTLAVVACMEGGFASVMAGRRAGDLYMACGELQQRILAEVMGGNVQKPKKSSIIQLKS